MPDDGIDKALCHLLSKHESDPGTRAIARCPAGDDGEFVVCLYVDGEVPFDPGRSPPPVEPKAFPRWIPRGGWHAWGCGRSTLFADNLPRVHIESRRLDLVAELLDTALAGRIDPVVEPVTWVAELALATPLFDPEDIFARLQARTRPYPPPLRRAIRDGFLSEAAHALDHARADAAVREKQLSHAGHCLLEVLHALNGQYLLQARGSLRAAAGMPRCPPDFAARVERALAGGAGGIDMLQALLDEVAALS